MREVYGARSADLTMAYSSAAILPQEDLRTRVIERYRAEWRLAFGLAFAKLGFFLTEFRLGVRPQWKICTNDFYVEGMIACPCGGMEAFGFVLSQADYDSPSGGFPAPNKDYAESCVNHFKSHILDEVERGILPAEWKQRVAA